MENLIHEVLETFLNKLNTPFSKIKIEKNSQNLYKINIESDEPNLLIGHHGENILALQHLVKLILWQQEKGDYNIFIDIDNYRKRQEENVLNLAERKVELVRKSHSPQPLPAMSPYFRRLIHLHLTQDKFHDITTESKGEGDYRFITIKPKLVI
jgi:spoIIIJ-associated protein